MKLKKFIIKDIYGDEFIYNCESKENAIECFITENGKDRLDEQDEIANAFYNEDYKELERLTGIKAKSQIEFEEKINKKIKD